MNHISSHKTAKEDDKRQIEPLYETSKVELNKAKDLERLKPIKESKFSQREAGTRRRDDSWSDAENDSP